MATHNFETVNMRKVPKSTFDHSHDVKMSGQMGALIPVLCKDVVPGDIINNNTRAFLRFMPMISPVMHEVNVDIHHFFVPMRILWPEWEDKITGNSDVAMPWLTTGVGSVGVGTIGDHLGLPVEVNNLGFSPAQFAAYRRIYNEWYRDQNLIDPILPDSLQPGENPDFLSILGELPLRRAWERDYFTSCLPEAQKGSPVTLPLISDDQDLIVTLTEAAATRTGAWVGTDDTVYTGDVNVQVTGGPPPLAGGTRIQTGETVAYDPQGTLRIENLNAEAVTLNTLRNAIALQQFFERDMRAGTRLVEWNYAHFGVRSPDSRLQRPEFLGGSRGRVTVSETLSTAQTVVDTQVTPLGQMAGHGISLSGGKPLRYFCEEHGFYIVIMSVMPRTAYQQGLPRQFTRNSRFDYLTPDLAKLGEQVVRNKEIYAAHSDPEGEFGYQPMFEEYRHTPNRVAGQMRTTLDFWHLGRIFADEPALNAEFINCNPDTRIFAVTDPLADHLVGHITHSLYITTALPRYGLPGLDTI